MKRPKFKIIILLLLGICVGLAQAHWVPEDGHKMHFPQMPDPSGWDICLRPMAVADDFQCSASGPISDIHFWVSWKKFPI